MHRKYFKRVNWFTGRDLSIKNTDRGMVQRIEALRLCHLAQSLKDVI